MAVAVAAVGCGTDQCNLEAACLLLATARPASPLRTLFPLRELVSGGVCRQRSKAGTALQCRIQPPQKCRRTR